MKTQNSSKKTVEVKYFNDLYSIVELIIDRATEQELTAWEISEKACLWYGTVNRLMTKQTKYPRFMTVWSMARAVGLVIELGNTPLNTKGTETGRFKVIS